jgi:hypothetical protein
MGYESSLHLIDIMIKPASIPVVKRALTTCKGPGLKGLEYFLRLAVLGEDRLLAFKASKDGLDPYVPDEDTNTVPALYGKWYESGKIARWLKKHCEKGGRIILHSMEADGEAWGIRVQRQRKDAPARAGACGKMEIGPFGLR